MLKLELKIDEKTLKLEGEREEVVEEALKFLYNIYPKLSLINKIVVRPDIEKLIERISAFVKILEDGTLIIKGTFPAEKGILLALAAAKIGGDWGIREKYLGIRELQELLNIKNKTVRNNCSKLSKDGYIRRDKRGKYIITNKGIYFLLESLFGEEDVAEVSGGG